MIASKLFTMTALKTDKLLVYDLERIEYSAALRIQQEYFDERIFQKLRSGGNKLHDVVLLCEHEPVFTLGKNGNEKHLLSAEGATYFRTNRGGDITYHGPGQLTVYPIIDLERKRISVARYVYLLEETIIELLRKYDLPGERVEGATGVWLDAGTTNERKICAIGIKASRHITMHGLAFNVFTDLRYFNQIIPCGIAEKGVTSLSVELGNNIRLDAVKHEWLKIFRKCFLY